MWCERRDRLQVIALLCYNRIDQFDRNLMISWFGSIRLVVSENERVRCRLGRSFMLLLSEKIVEPQPKGCLYFVFVFIPSYLLCVFVVGNECHFECNLFFALCSCVAVCVCVWVRNRRRPIQILFTCHRQVETANKQCKKQEKRANERERNRANENSMFDGQCAWCTRICRRM